MTSGELADLAGCAITDRTVAALNAYAAIITKWNRSINLVSKATEDQVWSRHIADSVQLWRHVPTGVRRLADLGSGAGFPGLVLALLASQDGSDPDVILIESDQRKSAFLREAARAMGVRVRVENARIEQVAPLGAQLVTARALAALPRLLELAVPHMAKGAVGLFPKGVGHAAEIEAARLCWSFDIDVFPSQTDSEARLLRVSNIHRKSGPDT